MANAVVVAFEDVAAIADLAAADHQPLGAARKRDFEEAGCLGAVLRQRCDHQRRHYCRSVIEKENGR